MLNRAYLLNWVYFIIKYIYSLGFIITYLRLDNKLYINIITSYYTIILYLNLL